jgi:hypothetical protein
MEIAGGPIETVTSATPTSVFLYSGLVAADVRKVLLHPTPNANGTLYYGGWKYPTALSADGDTFPCQDAVVYRMVPIWLRKLAEFEESRGRPGADAMVLRFEKMAEKSLGELREIVKASRPGSGVG